MHLLLIQTSPHSEGLKFICATDRNIVSSQKKLHSLLLSSKLCNCKNNEGFQWVLQLSFCNEIQWKHGAQGFFLHYKTIEHPGNIHTYTLTQGQTQRDVKGTAFLPEVFVLSASLCCCCRVHLLHTALLLCFPFSGLHTTYTATADRFLLKWKTVHMYMLLAKPINLDISKIWPPPIT